MDGKATIVHEADVQRQHIRLQVPAQLKIGEHAFTTCDWSHGGVALLLDNAAGKSLYDSVKIGSGIKGKLDFPFEGFNFIIDVEMEVRNLDSKKNRMGCRFTNLSRRNLSVLQYLVSAYMSGEIVQIGDFIDVVGRNNFTTARKLPSADEGLTGTQKVWRKFSRLIRAAAVAIISLSLFTYLITGLYTRLYVISPASAVVTSEMYAVEAPSSGKVFYSKPIRVDDMVKQGDPLFNITTAGGNAVSVDSPCDCVVKERMADNNSMTSKGRPVLRLVANDAKPYVQAYVKYDDALRLVEGSKAVLNFPGHHETVGGIVRSVQAKSTEPGISLVIVDASTQIPSEYIDDPVDVRVDTWLFQ